MFHVVEYSKMLIFKRLSNCWIKEYLPNNVKAKVTSDSANLPHIIEQMKNTGVDSMLERIMVALIF